MIRILIFILGMAKHAKVSVTGVAGTAPVFKEFWNEKITLFRDQINGINGIVVGY
jgi:hypothetical protein